jgi:hypothetical protein
MIDTRSETWAHIVKWAQHRINAATETLISEDTDEKSTVAARARIAVMRDLLREAEPKPDLPNTMTPDHRN